MYQQRRAGREREDLAGEVQIGYGAPVFARRIRAIATVGIQVLRTSARRFMPLGCRLLVPAFSSCTHTQNQRNCYLWNQSPASRAPLSCSRIICPWAALVKVSQHQNQITATLVKMHSVFVYCRERYPQDKHAYHAHIPDRIHSRPLYYAAHQPPTSLQLPEAFSIVHTQMHRENRQPSPGTTARPRATVRHQLSVNARHARVWQAPTQQTQPPCQNTCSHWRPVAAPHRHI